MADQDTDIQHADPQARRRVLIYVAVLVAVGVLGIAGIEEWLHRLRQDAATDPHGALEAAAQLLRIMAALISLSLACLGLVVARLSLRVLRAERFPPPGSHLLVDMPVVLGAAARRRAYVGLVVAAGLAALGVILPYLLWRTLYLLRSAPGAV